MSRRAGAWVLAAALGAAAGCKTFDAAVERATDRAVEKGWLKQSQAESIRKTSAAFRKSAADLSESEEYYIGRGVAAELLSRYEPSTDEALNRYVRLIGQAVAMASDRPETYGGYRFQVLESDEPNAFAAPGGFVLVTRGLVSLAENEDELACILAHEIAHVATKHGLKTIKTARLTSAFEILAREASKDTRAEDLGKLTESFEGAIDDIVTNLVVKGYSREKEFEADQLGAEFAARAGYDSAALARVLGRLGGGGGLLKTHPSSSARVQQLGSVATPAGYRASRARDDRFAKAVRGG
ncbi:MAG: M48 family metalloprotease [Elusimicrobia bacterium]|nr:M48 family metalloprotease [Elusimicrobiota bacterium]